MNTSSPTSATSMRANIWQRIFVRLSGGPTNQEKLEIQNKKLWFSKYKITLFFLLFSFTTLFEPEMVTYLNSHPATSQLETLPVTILGVHEKSPHLLVVLADGSLRNMEWPVTGSFRGAYNSYLLNEEERDRMTGCLATVRGALLRWTVSGRFRIWELDCPDKQIHIGMNITIPYMQRRINTQNSSWKFFLPIWFLFFLVTYLRERRGNV